MNKQFVITASILIGLSIILGAFGAHGLKQFVEADAIEIFEKGVKYQMYSGLALLIIGLSTSKFNFKLFMFYNLNIIGIIIFSGMLYALTFKGIYPALKICGAIVPVGGFFLISSWVVLIIQLIKKQN